MTSGAGGGIASSGTGNGAGHGAMLSINNSTVHGNSANAGGGISNFAEGF